MINEDETHKHINANKINLKVIIMNRMT